MPGGDPSTLPAALRGDSDLKSRLQEFCRTDNVTNFVYVARAWLVIVAAIGGAIWCFEATRSHGGHVLWNVPVSLLAIVAVGASQHQLAGATHEATHHSLFKNRRLNELVSDWLCMFPLFSSTYTFRLYHLQHHQFINDPKRDPDLLYVLALCVALAVLYRLGDPALLLIVPAVAWAGIAGLLCSLPERHWEQGRIRPVYRRRYLASSRLAFITLLLTGVTWGQLVTGRPVWWWFAVYWIVPLLTTFPFFMVLRQLVQHGNGDRSFMGNTRVFLVNPLLRYAVFPFGMDWHAPHHMFATVPHYNLPALHEFLLRDPEYRQECIVVENYLIPAGHGPHRRPTVVEILGPEYAGTRGEDVWIDNTVLDHWDVEDKDAIFEHSHLSLTTRDKG